MAKLKGFARRINGGFQHRLCEQARFGESKHQAKAEARAAYIKEHGNTHGYNPAKVDGVFSIKTMETYRKAMETFAVWAAEHGCKNAKQVTQELAGQYLQERQAAGLSAWSVSRDMAAINKTMGYNLTKAELGLSERRLSDITRSRNMTANDKRDFTAYSDQIALARACGCRRQSVTAITANDCIRNDKGLVVGVRVVEKGGKERVAPVLNAYKEELTKVVERATSAHADQSEPLFARYDSHIDNHSFRAEYANQLIQQLEQEQANGQPWFGGDLRKEDYINLRGTDKAIGATYKGHPTDVVAAVSGALGHNRLDVVVNHYLR